MSSSVRLHSPWDRLAALYGSGPEDIPESLIENTLIEWPPVIDFLARELGTLEGARILDFGCGAGHFTNHLARLGVSVVGVDPSHGMIAEARRHAPALEFREGGTEALRPGEAFDAAMLLMVCPFVADLAPLIDGVVRHVRPGGLVVLSGFNPAFVHALLSRGMLFRDFDDPVRPRRGILNPTGEDPIPVYVRNADEYTYVCEVFGLRLTFEARPPFTRGFLERHPRHFPTETPERIILGFRKQG